jgi:hypothetical protein
MNALWDRGAVASRSGCSVFLVMLRGARSGAVIVAGNRKSSSGQSRPKGERHEWSLGKINVVLDHGAWVDGPCWNETRSRDRLSPLQHYSPDIRQVQNLPAGNLGVVSPIRMLLLELNLERRPRGIEDLLVSGAAWQPQPRAVLLLVGRAKGDHREKLLPRPAGISHRQISRRHHLVIRIPAQPLGRIVAEPISCRNHARIRV